MQLHDFMSTHRDEILESCMLFLHERVAVNADLDRDVNIFFDEMHRAVRRDSGFPESDSPLPGKSETAARIGLQPRRSGIEPAMLPLIFGAISNAIGSVGQRYDLAIGAAEYRIFNECMDAGVAASIEKLWDREQQDRKERITQSFGYLAHELRNALGNAALAFKLLRAGEVAINGRTAAILGNNLARMDALVARTLGSVRLDAGIAPDLRPLCVATLLRQVEAAAIPQRGIAVTLELDESLHVEADELLLASAVGNLLHNAMKFSRDGGRIQLRCRCEGDRVVIEVEDECGGLPPGSSERLFLPFVKGTAHPASTGLGLAITKRAVEEMHGHIDVVDEPGQGCIFRLSFPLVMRERTPTG